MTSVKQEPWTVTSQTSNLQASNAKFARYAEAQGWTVKTCKSKRKAMNRNWYNQKANPAFNTKAGNK